MLLLGVFVAEEALILQTLTGQLHWFVLLFPGKSQTQFAHTYNFYSLNVFSGYHLGQSFEQVTRLQPYLKFCTNAAFPYWINLAPYQFPLYLKPFATVVCM